MEQETNEIKKKMIFHPGALTTELLRISVSGMWLMQPYPESFALKSLSICILAVENSLNIACKYHESIPQNLRTILHIQKMSTIES